MRLLLTRHETRAGGDSGLTLVELLVTTVLLGILGSLMTRAVVDTNSAFRVVDDQTQGLSDVRVAAERLDRDIRQARSVVCNPPGTAASLAAADPTCQYHLQVWIDYDSNYVQTPDETVTWSLAPSSRPGQFDLLRQVGTGPGVVEARTIVVQVAFTYDVQPGPAAPAPGQPHPVVVRVNMTYDANTRSGTTNKTVVFTGRLRNVG